MEPVNPSLTDDELINSLRRCASIWFKNSDLLLLEEFIKRYKRESANAHLREAPK